MADGVELLRGDVFDAADVAAAEGVDDDVEAVAGVFARGGVDLVAGFGADSAVLAIAVGEGDAGDGRGGDGSRSLCAGLGAALGGRGVGGDAEVEERSAEGGVGVRVEADGGDGAELGGVRGGGGVEAKGADLEVLAVEVPGGGNGEGDAVVGVVKWAGGGSGGFRRGRLASEHRGNGLGYAGGGAGL